MKTQYILVDVDTQVDFMLPHGALYVPALEAVATNISLLTQTSLPRLGSVDSHAYDAFEFQDNGGPFPPHCVKGTEGWLKPAFARPDNMRFVPMGRDLYMGESRAGEGNRAYTEEFFTEEVMGGISVYFEKEVYSLFANPFAEKAILHLVHTLTAKNIQPVFAVYGYCTGDFCVDAAATGLADLGVSVALVLDATAPLSVKGTLEETTLKTMKKRGIPILSTVELVS